MPEPETRVLILGSAPDAIAARDWPKAPFTHIVAINNAWRVRRDWDFLIHPEDFPSANLPPERASDQRIVTAADYVPAQNSFGGFVFAGGTMAFTAGYWALAVLNPSVIAYFGCDMVYPATGKTHFYGTGAPDPLRADVTLRSLEAKSARLALFAARQSCRMVRLSQRESRLVLPSVPLSDLGHEALPDATQMTGALAAEGALGYAVPSGRYWESEQTFDPAAIDAVDRLWLEAYARATGVPIPESSAATDARTSDAASARTGP
ncbi:hypothetical protein Q5Y75_10490 [Ruegeria sp. 2205SS24-7]|uniref:hypothetical protein n=1 Tax=Ruegeria discodermiae TaxID=3064389 RepID=UPI0027427FA7|nr:hypothetical protein [Ruegeria sp. 2205SS24-7]MDP5217647.1 hypothetical protein [Ruegeria sp. 2205SS24-7]